MNKLSLGHGLKIWQIDCVNYTDLLIYRHQSVSGIMDTKIW